MSAAIKHTPACFIALLLFVVLLSSCNKDPYEIGIDLLPASDTLNCRTTDTCTVVSFAVKQDSVRTDHSSSLILGSIMDPVFGKLTSSFYTQLRLTEDAPYFGTSPTLDSLVMVLYYSSYYGDTTTRQHIRVYELSENLSYDSIYFSSYTHATNQTILADEDFTPRYSDSVKIRNTKYPAQLRVNLSKMTNYLGNKLINAPSSALETNEAFLKFFKGLYVTAEPVSNKGAIFNFSVSTRVSSLVAYYHNTSDPENDSLQFTMAMNSGCANFIHTDHNSYLDASQELKQQIMNHDSALGTEKLFLQGMGGVKMKVKLPNIKALQKGKFIVVNDAILEMKDDSPDSVFKPPVSISLVRQDSAGRIGYLPDEAEGTEYFGGSYNATKHTYSFRITRHIQNILRNVYKTTFDLYVNIKSPVKNFASPNRVVLTGTKPTEAAKYGDRMKLKLTYTILN